MLQRLMRCWGCCRGTHIATLTMGPSWGPPEINGPLSSAFPAGDATLVFREVKEDRGASRGGRARLRRRCIYPRQRGEGGRRCGPPADDAGRPLLVPGDSPASPPSRINVSRVARYEATVSLGTPVVSRRYSAGSTCAISPRPRASYTLSLVGCCQGPRYARANRELASSSLTTRPA